MLTSPRKRRDVIIPFYAPKHAPHRARFNDNDDADTLMRGHLYRGRFDHTLIFAFPITGITQRYFSIGLIFPGKFLLHYFFRQIHFAIEKKSIYKINTDLNIQISSNAEMGGNLTTIKLRIETLHPWHTHPAICIDMSRYSSASAL